ncbi:MAG: SPOR domain-containing protein [Bryobacteraceae bacterium]
MPRRSEGEVEVMLSDRQLILLFVIGVSLLAVFFAMGFLVGKRMAATPATGPAAEPAAGKALSKMAERLSKPQPTVGTVSENAEASVRASAVAKPPAEPEPASAARVAEPPRGTVFLQVSAQDLANAQVFADALAQRGFRTVIAPGPTRDVFRVLVGPLEGPEQIARTRQELKAAGFESIVRKY